MAGLVLMPVAGFLFALRAGVVIGPLVALALWRGWRAGPLSLAAGLLLGVAVPLVTLAAMPADLGGFNSEYVLDLLAAHWLALGAFGALALAAWRALSTASGANRDPAAAPAEAP